MVHPGRLAFRRPVVLVGGRLEYPLPPARKNLQTGRAARRQAEAMIEPVFLVGRDDVGDGLVFYLDHCQAYLLFALSVEVAQRGPGSVAAGAGVSMHYFEASFGWAAVAKIPAEYAGRAGCHEAHRQRCLLVGRAG